LIENSGFKFSECCVSTDFFCYVNVTQPCSRVDSGGAPPEWVFRKGAKPDFCLSEFSYYSKYLWILKPKGQIKPKAVWRSADSPKK